MISNFIVPLFPVLSTFIGIICCFSMMLIWLQKQRKHQRESPLTRDLIRPPGYSLQLKVNEMNEEIPLYIVGIITVPLLFFSIHISQSYFGNQPESVTRIVTSLILGLWFVIFIGRRLLRLLDKRKQFILGLQGEMFTGEELNQLMLDGCRVFHDIQFPYGNIDHVVISQSGVYSVNTKMRGKPKEGEGRAELIVDHKNSIIQFPDWKYRIPTKQLETESNWLSQHLASAIGKQIKVEPILAYPGWFIKQRIGRGSVYVINPQNPKKFFIHSRTILDSVQIQQIAHQLEQLCRNVKPSFKEKKEWESNR